MRGITHKETSEYVAQYYRDRYGLITNGEEVLSKYPWHEIVWEKFFAYAFYKVRNYFESWDDVPNDPTEGMYVNIISYEVLNQYQYRGGHWRNIGSATASCWKE
ncbi:hypothetical protein [Paenibacillus anseongense]|uniref:hypothetical protein n=1 Tax=Paenibacillus anseongense TaxID=2682845 RepID=UPI002DBA692D|nr:hypothetical protein [Paenibacillus anseongense]MEC0266720.1 hypothetical protein [Paenibacillus anseongense]